MKAGCRPRGGSAHPASRLWSAGVSAIFLAEDYDAFRDDDGCPEADNDNDNFPDGSDQCPGTDNLAGPDGALGVGGDQNHSGILGRRRDLGKSWEPG